MKNISYSEVQECFPEAWAAVPECYQNDSVLEFGIDEYGSLWAISEDPACTFEAVWDSLKGEWY